MAFKPKPPPEELTEAFKSHLREVPSAVVPAAPEIEREERVGEGRRRKAPPVVQLNLNVTEELADIISEEAQKAGSTRRFIARLMKEAGYPVPQADLTPYMNVRRRKGIR